MVTKKGGDFAVCKSDVESYLNTTHGLIVPADIKDTAPSEASSPFFDLDPKSVMEPRGAMFFGSLIIGNQGLPLVTCRCV